MPVPAPWLDTISSKIRILTDLLPLPWTMCPAARRRGVRHSALLAVVSFVGLRTGGRNCFRPQGMWESFQAYVPVDADWCLLLPRHGMGRMQPGPTQHQ